ncbi:STAS domain-containing protein [Streptomyces longisporoflavus]|uniref:STAS domain-containing protein n=1 Tax=Streptomyces longisporoflavus TaxID=28044 RepID=A0ABW7QZQ7_9ACTN
MPRFRLRRRSEPRQEHAHTCVRLRGEISGENAASTGRLLINALTPGLEVLEVDLGRVTYLSPDGCMALFSALVAARERDTRLIVTHADKRATATLDRIGFFRALADPEG